MTTPISPPSVTELPEAPERGNRTTFRSLAETFVAALSTFRTQLVALATNVYNNAVIAYNGSVNAAQSLTDCQAEVSNCQAEVSNCQTEVSNCQDQVTLATAQADRAEGYVENIIADPNWSTSSTSLNVGTGVKSLTVGTGENFTLNMWVIVIYGYDPTIWMKGYITSYTSGTGALEVSIVQKQGTGTFSDWLVTQTAPTVASEYSPVSFKGMVMAEMF